MPEEEKYKRIEEFLSGNLSGDELNSFNLELAENPKLRQELAFRKEVEKALNEKDVEGFREKVEEVISNQTLKVKKGGMGGRVYLGIAAGILLLILSIFGISKLVKDSTSCEYLYTTYYEPYDDLISGRGNNNNQAIESAMYYYNRQDYLNAAKIFREIDKTNKPLLHFYLGICYLNSDESKKAEEIFIQLSAKDSLFQIESMWYLALTYLKQGEMQKTKLVLEDIINWPVTSSYQLKAKELYSKF